MKKFVFSIAMVTMMTGAYAQQVKISLNAGANYSSIGEVTQSAQFSLPVPQPTGFGYATYQSTIQEEYLGKAGGFIGSTATISLGKRLFLETGLQINLIRFEKRITVKEISNLPVNVQQPGTFPTTPGAPMGNIWFRDVNPTTGSERVTLAPYNGNTSLLYTSLPLLAGTSFFNERLQIKAGFNTSILTYAERYQNRYVMMQPTSGGMPIGQFEEYKDTSKDGLQNVLIGSSAEATWRLTRKVGLNFNYTHQWNSLYSAQNSNAWNNLFSFGLRYSLN